MPKLKSRLPVTGYPLQESSSASASLVLPGDRAPDIVAFERQTVDFFVSAADILGVPKSVAAIYGVIFASPQPLSFAEIDARLSISTGSISQGLRVLREVGAIREARLPSPVTGYPFPVTSGSARATARYEPDLALRNLVSRFIETRLEAQLKTGKSRLSALKEAVPLGANGDAAILRGRLKSLQDWHTKARGLLPLARTFLKLT